MANLGRRQVGAPGGSSTLSGYSAETFGDAGQAMWENAGRSIDAAASAYAAAQKRQREAEEREEEAQRVAAGRAEQAAREAKAAEDTAALNASLAETRKKMNAPGYVSPEGAVQPVSAQEAERARLAATDPKFRTEVAAQKNKMVDDDIIREEKIREAGLKDQAAAGKSDARREDRALNEVDRFNQAVENRDARVDRLKQRMEDAKMRQLTRDELQEVSQLRRAIEMDDKVESARAIFEDDARLYAKAKSQVSMAAAERGVKLSKSDAEQATRDEMERMRDASGWYTTLPTGERKFDPDTSPARADLEAKVPITVESYQTPITQEELARASEIRYRMPQALRDWKPGMWKAAGVDEATAIRMAAVGATQAGREAVSGPAPAASGRREPVAANTATAGIGSGIGRPAPAPKIKPAPKPPAPVLAAPPLPAGGGPASGARPAPTPTSPAPAGRPSLVVPEGRVTDARFGMPSVKVEVPESMRRRDTKEQVLSGKMVGEKAAAGQRKVDNLSNAIVALEDVSPAEARQTVYELAKKVPGVITGAVPLKDGLDQLKRIKQYETEAQMGALNEAKAAGASDEDAVRASMDPELSSVARGTMSSDARQAAEMTPEKATEQQFGQAVALLDRPRLELQTRAAQAIGADLQKDETSPTGYEDPAVASGRGLASILEEKGVPAGTAKSIGSVFGELVSEALDPLELVGALGAVRGARTAISTAERVFQATGAISAGLGVKDAAKQLEDLRASGTFFNKDGSVSDSGLQALTQLGISAGFAGAAGKGLTTEASAAAAPQQDEGVTLRSGARQTDDLLRTYGIEPDQGNLAPKGGFRVSPAEQAAMTGQKALDQLNQMAAPTAEQTKAAQTDEDTIALAADPVLARAEVGAKVEAPSGYEILIPDAEWTKVDDRTKSTTIQTAKGPVRLEVRLDEEGLVMSASDLEANRGVTELQEGQEFAGMYTPGKRDLNLGKRDLIQILRGRGMEAKAHEVLHFMRNNGLIPDAEWSEIETRSLKRAQALAAEQGQTLETVVPDVRASLIEEAAANEFGRFSRNRYLLRDAPAGLSAFSKVWETLHSLGSQLVGGNKAAFDKLLRQGVRNQLQAAPSAAPAAGPATQSTPVKAEVAGPADAPVRAQEAPGTTRPRKRKPLRPGESVSSTNAEGVTTRREGPKASVAPVRKDQIPRGDATGRDVARAFHDDFKQFDTPRRRALAASFMARSRSDQEKLGLKPYDEAGRPIHTWTRVEKGDMGETYVVQYREDVAKAEPQVVGLLQPYERGPQKGTVGMSLGGRVTGGDNRAMKQMMKALGIRHSEVRSAMGDDARAKSDIEEGPNPDFQSPAEGTELEGPTGAKAAIGRVKKRNDSVSWRTNTPTVKGTGKGGKVSITDLHAWIEARTEDISGLPEEKQIEVMVARAAAEIEHQKKQRRSGAGWYRGDIRELEHAAKKAFPELEKPEQMGLFKAVLAASSFGNKPAPNAEQAFNIWETFRKTGEFPATQTSGKFWSGSPGFGTPGKKSTVTSKTKLDSLRKQLGSWDAVVEFLSTEHPVAVLRGMGFGVSGKAKEQKMGAHVLGPKGGPFYANISGRLGDLTGDLWFSRTFNRLRGTKIVDAPRNDGERAVMRKFIEAVAKKTGVAPADAQAMLWFHEKDLYGKLAHSPDFGTYSISGRQALESIRNKRETDETGTAPARRESNEQPVGFEAVWSTSSKLNSEFDFSTLTDAQKEQFADAHGKWVLEDVEVETGAKLSPVVEGKGPDSWGGQPNLVVSITGSPDQVRAAASMLGLALEQDAVAVSLEVKGQTPTSVPTGIVEATGHSRPWGTRDFLADVRKAFASAYPEADTKVAIEVNFRDGKPFVKAYPMDAADAGWVRDNSGRLTDALRTAVKGADPEARTRGRLGEFEVEFPGNDWKENPNGEGYRSVLDDLGHSAEGLDEFRSRVAADRKATWEAVTTGQPKASVAKKRGKPTSVANFARNVSGPVIKRLREIHSVGGRRIGNFIADQLEARRQAYEQTSGTLLDKYRSAVASLDGKDAKWDKVQQALDGKPEAKGKLNAAELKAYDEIRAVFAEVKRMAIKEQVFSGQGIREYFPHMREEGQFDEMRAVEAHLEYLQTERPDLLQKLAEENEAWTGLVGSADNLELAAIDLAKNWNKENFWRGNPHLEKFRGEDGIPYRKDSAVGEKYIVSAVRRIMDARYLGSKSEVISQGIRSIRDAADQKYVRDAMREILGGGATGHLGTALMKEISVLNGLSKLGSAGLAQLTQLSVAGSEMGGSSGFVEALADSAKVVVALARSRELLYREAARSGATFAADSGEAMRNFAGTGNNTYAEKAHRALWRVLGLGSRKLEFMVDTTYGVKTLDKFARVMADRAGRETYLRALKKKDRALLIELLGSPEHADGALKDDAPRVAQLEATFRAGGTDPLLNDSATRMAGSRLALAGKRFADKTQYRTDVQDQPLLFTNPFLKAANTFYSFAYAHWRWNAEHVAAGRAAAKAGDTKTAVRHAKVLALQHLVSAPLIGGAVIALRALATGKGVAEKDEDDIKTFGEAWAAMFDLDTVGRDEYWTAQTLVARYLQGWQYGGGIGYPMSFAERTLRAAKDYDKGRGFASLAAGSPGEMSYDIFKLASAGVSYSLEQSKATKKEMIRNLYTVLFNHLSPNVLGISSAVRRRLVATEERPVKNLGWLGVFDPDARWTLKHGWTSDAAEQAREDALTRLREREAELAEEDE